MSAVSPANASADNITKVTKDIGITMRSSLGIALASGCALGLWYSGISVASIAGWSLAGVTVLLIKSVLTEDKPPKLYYIDTPLSRHVLKHCKSLTQPFRPPYWARNNHIQTIMPSVFLPKVNFEFKREYLELSDGGAVALDYGITGEESLKPDCPVLLALPGVNGDAESVINLCKEAYQRGFRPVVFNKRGLAGSHLTTPKLQSFGDPEDFREVVKYLQKSYPGSQMVAVGVSAGSGLLASYLGAYDVQTDLTAAVCNCPGYVLKDLLQKIPEPYLSYIMRGLKQMIQRHRPMLAQVLDVDAAVNARNFTEFEEHVYSKIYGFKTFEDYLKANEPARDMYKAVTPTLCINSEDDPVCIEELFLYDIFNKVPSSMLAVTSEGGHCGFVERNTWKRWADDLALDYIEAVMRFNKTN